MRMLRLSCVIAFVGALTLLGGHDGRANFVGQQLVCDGANANSGTITTKDSGGTVRTFDLNVTSTAQCAAVKAASTAALATDPALVTRNFDIGAQADAVCGTATGTCSLIALQKFANTASSGSIPAGAATIGNVFGAPNVTPTDCSGTIASGGTANNAFTAGATKHGFTIANIDTSEVLWFSMTTTAAASTAASYPLAPATATTFANLSSFTAPLGLGINTALSVIATTTGHKFTCTWW